MKRLMPDVVPLHCLIDSPLMLWLLGAELSSKPVGGVAPWLRTYRFSTALDLFIRDLIGTTRLIRGTNEHTNKPDLLLLHRSNAA
jgi:hypothetical protein